MIITATEFNRRQGYFMELANQGVQVIVERLKPVHARFEIKPLKTINKSDKTQGELILKKLSESKVDSKRDWDGKDAVEYQKWIRT